MKDLFGTELETGDMVIYCPKSSHRQSCHLMVGIIQRFTPTGRLALHRLYPNPTTLEFLKPESHNVIKCNAKMEEQVLSLPDVAEFTYKAYRTNSMAMFSIRNRDE